MQRKLFILFSFVFLIYLSGCKDRNEEPISPDQQVITKSVASCEGCHTNYQQLKKVYTPDPPSEGGGGCGGDTPHIEPYDRDRKSVV